MSGTSPLSAPETAEIVNPLVHGVNEVFATILHARTTRVGLEHVPRRFPQHEVNAVVDLTGRAIGRFWLSFPSRTARAAAGRILNRPVTEVDDAIEDATCELVNVVAGVAKPDLERLQLVLTRPQVLPPVLANRFPYRSTPMKMDFRSDIGPFFVVFGFASLVADDEPAAAPLSADEVAAVDRLLG